MKLSIIVCTRNRAKSLQACLESISSSIIQARCPDVEIVIVDNNSNDDTPAIIANWAASSRHLVQALTQIKKGLSASRNLAIQKARGELIVFLDDDCRMSPSYVQEVLSYDAADQDLVLRGGTVELGDPIDLPLTTITVSQAKTWRLRDNSTRHENLGDAILGCNMAMRRDIIEIVGGFDERLGPGTPFHSGEDPDFVFRVYLKGITVMCVPDMVVKHYHGRRTSTEGKNLLKNYSLGGGAMYAKYFYRHPNFCRPLYWDLKHWIKEIQTGTNQFMPNIDFSYGKKISYNLLGATMYFRIIFVEFFFSLVKIR